MALSSKVKTGTIEQTVLFSNATPYDVFEALMDEKKHAAFTGGEAMISRKVNGTFTSFDGWATGKNIELVKDKKIVQTWRPDDWSEGVWSTCTYVIKTVPTGTEMTFTQVNVPKPFVKTVALGWYKYYWKPMQKFFDSRVNKKK